MHPIERLRHVARSEGAPPTMLVRESAAALGAFGNDPAGMVAACRRIIDRQLTCAPLWWLCARMLCAPEPMVEARAAVDELDGDPTARLLGAALPDDAVVTTIGWPDQVVGALRRRGDVEAFVVDTDGDSFEAVRQLAQIDVDAVAIASRNVAGAVRHSTVVLLDALAVGPEAALLSAGSHAAAAIAHQEQVPVWLVGGVGRLLPESMFDALVSRWELSADPLESVEEVVPLDLVDRFVGVAGVVGVEEGLQHTDCPVAAELFRLVG